MKASKKRLISFMLALSLVLSGVSSPTSVEAKAKAPKVVKTMTLKVGQSKTIKVSGVKVKKKSFSVTSKKGKKSSFSK